MTRKTTEAFDAIDLDDLATVTGGCRRRGGMMPCCCPGGDGGEVNVSVATGGAQPTGAAQPPQLM